MATLAFSTVHPIARMARSALQVWPDVGSSRWLTEVVPWARGVLIVCAGGHCGRRGDAVHPMRGRVDQLVRPPVFVDATGRRRLWATWGAGATSALCCVYVFVLGVGLAGGAVRPGELLPGASRRNEARNEARYEPAARVARAPAAVPTTTTDTAPPATARTSAQRAATTPTEAPAGTAPSGSSPSSSSWSSPSSSPVGVQAPMPAVTWERPPVAAASSTAPASPTPNPTASPTSSPASSPTTSPSTSPASTPQTATTLSTTTPSSPAPSTTAAIHVSSSTGTQTGG
jgi:hypothetical protein